MTEHRTLSSMGHNFGEKLRCKWCEVSWDAHQTDPESCEEAERCERGHFRIQGGGGTGLRAQQWKCRKCREEDAEALAGTDLCPRGHPRTEDFGHFRPDGKRWECLVCNRQRDRERRARQKAERFAIRMLYGGG